MRKLGVRVVSAALAACMMASVMPVSAFAAGEGNTDPSTSASTENEQQIPANNVIEAGGTYIMDENCNAARIVISAPGEDVKIKLTGDVNPAQGVILHVQKVKDLEIDAGTYTINNSNQSFLFIQPATGESESLTGKLTVNGGNYINANFTFKDFGSDASAELKNVTMDNAIVTNNSGRTVTVNGGKYKTQNASEALFVNGNSSTLVLENDVSVNSAGSGIRNSENSKVEITGGTFNTTGAAVWNAADTSVATITGGTFIADDTVFNNRGTMTIGSDASGAANDITITSDGTGGAVLNSGNLTFNGGTVNAQNGSGIHSVYDGQAVTTTINGGTLNCKDNICLQASGENSLNVTLGSDVTLSDTARYDVVLRENQTIGISGFRDDEVSIWLFDPADERHLTADGAPSGLNIVCKNGGYTVKYNETNQYYYLSQNTEYTLTLDNATAEKEDGADATGEVKKTTVTSGDKIPAGTKVYLTATPAPEGQKFGSWKVTVGDAELTGEALSEVLTGSVLTMPEGDTTVTALYVPDTGDDPIDPDDSDTGSSGTGGNGGALAAVVVGGAAAWGIYEAGTGIYRMMNMRGIPLPTTRAELALLIWQRADKPEPESTALYDDIDEDDADLQKAARWMVEQELMDEKDNNKFKPYGHVTKLRVCTTWNEAKEKGLID